MMFLLIVTLSSILLAAIMSVIAWRLAAQERRRSEARIAALAAEIHEPAALAASSSRGVARRAEVGIRAELPRLAAVSQSRRGGWDEALPLHTAEAERAGAELFASAQRPASARRFAFTAVVVVAVAGVLFVAGLLRGGESASTRAGAVRPPAGD